MADNLVANPGAGGATLATDEIGGVHYPRGQLVFGADGVATDVSAAAPLPVALGTATVAAAIVNSPTVMLAGTVAAAIVNAPTVTVSGTVSATIVNSPSVSIAGTANVALAATAAVAVVSAPNLPAAADWLRGTTAGIADGSVTQVIASAAGKAINLTAVLVTNAHASVGTAVHLLDGAATVLTGYAAAGGGGFALSLPVPLRGGVGNPIRTQMATSGALVFVSLVGFAAA